MRSPKYRKAILVLFTIALSSLLVACSPRASVQNTQEGSNAQSDQQARMNVPTNTSAMPSFLAVAISTAAAIDDVGPYEVIEGMVYTITHTLEHPQGPEVGPDGIVDAKIIQQLDAYNAVLKGKRVLDWTGCASEAYPSVSMPGSLNVAVYMKQNNAEPEGFTQVELLGLTSGQVQSLGLVLGNCVPIKFSGTFAQVSSDGRIAVENVTIKRID